MNTNRIRNVTVGTTKKSTDARHSKWFRRKARQVGDGGLEGRIMYFETAAWLISMPSLSSSPWIRGAPHRTLSRLMRLIRFLMSDGTEGRPGPRGRDFQDQNARKPSRCHRTTVSSLTITTASRQRDQR